MTRIVLKNGKRLPGRVDPPPSLMVRGPISFSGCYFRQSYEIPDGMKWIYLHIEGQTAPFNIIFSKEKHIDARH